MGYDIPADHHHSGLQARQQAASTKGLGYVTPGRPRTSAFSYRAPRLIALTSPLPQSGKSTVADYLSRRGYVRHRFAGTLKAMLHTFLITGLGVSRATAIRMIDGDLKETPISGLGVTPRHLMQTLGTEWGRDSVRNDLWVHLSTTWIRNQLDLGHNVVVDDMRFLNENARMKELGGICVRVIRLGVSAAAVNHRSEGELAHVPMLEIVNDGTLGDLYAKVDRAFNLPDFGLA